MIHMFPARPRPSRVSVSLPCVWGGGAQCRGRCALHARGTVSVWCDDVSWVVLCPVLRSHQFPCLLCRARAHRQRDGSASRLATAGQLLLHREETAPDANLHGGSRNSLPDSRHGGPAAAGHGEMAERGCQRQPSASSRLIAAGQHLVLHGEVGRLLHGENDGTATRSSAHSPLLVSSSRLCQATTTGGGSHDRRREGAQLHSVSSSKYTRSVHRTTSRDGRS